jgi:hypothetical protein
MEMDGGIKGAGDWGLTASKFILPPFIFFLGEHYGQTNDLEDKKREREARAVCKSSLLLHRSGSGLVFWEDRRSGPSLLTKKRYKDALTVVFGLNLTIRVLEDQLQRLDIRPAHWQHHAASGTELMEQARRNVRSGGCY